MRIADVLIFLLIGFSIGFLACHESYTAFESKPKIEESKGD